MTSTPRRLICLPAENDADPRLAAGGTAELESDLPRPAMLRILMALPGLGRAAVVVAVLLGCLMALAVSLVVLGPATAGAATVAPPQCPPECGFVAAGDPLLIPYLTVNPGPGWLALPASDVQSYVDSLHHNLARLDDQGVEVNVAAARWLWINHGYGLLMVVVSSPSLTRLNLSDPSRNAGDLCAASKGAPRSQLAAVPGVPRSVAGLCAFPAHAAWQGATVVAFNRGDVAVLMEITSRSGSPIDPRTTALAAQQQYLSVPSGGVLVSEGSDVELVVVWLLLAGLLVFGLVSSARRRGSWRGPLDAVAEAFRRRRVALAVSLVAIVGAMAFSMVDSSFLHGNGQWYESGFNDFWRNWTDGAFVTYSGGLGHLYILDKTLETAPAWQVLIAPVARLGSHLSYPDPSTVLYPRAFWLAGPLFLGAMALPLCAGDHWLDVMGVTGLGRRLVVLGTLAVVLPPIALFGHAEDLLALGAMLYGLAAALAGRPRAAGWWLGFGLAFQFFAFLAVPLACIFLGRRRWWAAIVPMVAVSLGFLAVPLATEPGATVGQLLHQKVFDDLGYISPTWNLDPGVASFIRVLIAAAAIPAALILVRRLPRADEPRANLIVWVLAALFTLRVAEPELVPYFLAPALALFAISAARRPWWRLLATVGLSVWLNWWLHVAVNARWSLWLLLIGQLVVLGWLAWPEGPLQPEAGRPNTGTDRASRSGQRHLATTKS